MTVIYTVTGGDQEQIRSFTANEAGDVRFDRKSMTVYGPDGATFVATVTRVIADG